VVWTNAGAVSVRVCALVEVVVVVVGAAAVVEEVVGGVVVVVGAVAPPVVVVMAVVVAAGVCVRVTRALVVPDVRGREGVVLALVVLAEVAGLVAAVVEAVAPPPQLAIAAVAAAPRASATMWPLSLIGARDGCHSQSRRATDMVRRDGSESDGS
jgi:hypothetical protein